MLDGHNWVIAHSTCKSQQIFLFCIWKQWKERVKLHIVIPPTPSLITGNIKQQLSKHIFKFVEPLTDSQSEGELASDSSESESITEASNDTKTPAIQKNEQFDPENYRS